VCRDEGGLSDWTFTSTKFWGESPNGVWTLAVVDDPKSKWSCRSCDCCSRWFVAR